MTNTTNATWTREQWDVELKAAERATRRADRIVRWSLTAVLVVSGLGMLGGLPVWLVLPATFTALSVVWSD